MSTTLDKDYWSSRWQSGQTGWDTGGITPPIRQFIDGIEDHALRILVPGCGNGYEAQYLWEQGFKNVHVIDLAAQPLRQLHARVPAIPSSQLIEGDFFQLDLHFDIIIEQTFFCALPPAMRQAYAQHMHRLLVPGGVLAGLLFKFPLTTEGPPFGGSEVEYRALFEPLFVIEAMHEAPNSIPPRQGNELFFQLRKPA